MEPKTALRLKKANPADDRVQAPSQGNAALANGFLPSAIILTMSGEVPMHDVTPGMRVISRDRGVAVVKLVTRVAKRCKAVSIKAGSLGHRRPPSDVVLPAGTRLLIRDWRAEAIFAKEQALVQAHDLHDGEFVKRLPEQDLDLICLEFDLPQVLYVDGLEMACQTDAS